MIIKDLIIKNFGACSEVSLRLEPGINIIYGENESGKSTIHGFIQAVFFGVRKMRGRAAKTDDYNRFLPWKNPGWYEGAVRFTCGGKNFRLERNFQRSLEQTHLVCETDGELLSVEDGDLEMLLGKINETVYKNTVSVGQMKSRTGEELIQELRNYISNYEGSGEAFLDVKEALGILREKKKEQEQKWKEMTEKEEKEKRILQTKVEYITEDAEHLREKAENLEQEIAAHRQELQKTFHVERDVHREGVDTKEIPEGATEEKTEKKNALNRMSRKMFPVSVVSLCFLLLVEMLIWRTSGAEMKAFFGGGILAAALGVCVGFWRLKRRGMNREKRRGFQDKGAKAKEERGKVLKAEILKKEAQRQELLAQIQQKTTELMNKREELEEWEETEAREQVKKETEAIDLAMKTIERLALEMQNSVSAALKHKVSRILCAMTEGKYREVLIDENLHITLLTKERLIPLYQASTGTIEQIYLALRMAVGELLCKEEPMPVILDETFAMYDDKRLAQTLKWLWQEKEQILVFTCNKREIQILKSQRIPFTLVEL